MVADRGGKPALRIGILGGTFNPVHLGHLRLAEEAQEKLKLDRVIFIPAKIPPHKERKGIAGARDRFRMTVLATQDHDKLFVSAIELDRPGKSYSIDTLRQLRKKYPAARLFFLIGSDSVPELPAWKNIDRLLELAQFMAAGRPGFTIRKLPSRIGRLAGTKLDISSTGIRELRKKGKSIRYLVPEAVRKYIVRKKLYR